MVEQHLIQQFLQSDHHGGHHPDYAKFAKSEPGIAENKAYSTSKIAC
ncbi:hypothetical protein [Collimonas fungivorans]|nr:hypothetical protein [Collimonas fungivorans]